MAKFQALYVWILANKPMFVAVLYAVSQFATTLQMHIPADDMPKWLGVILKWAGYIAPEGTKGLVGRFSMPFLHVPRAKKEIAAPPIAPAVVVFLLCSLGLTACTFCQQPANKNTVECKAYRSLVQCGPKTLAIIASDVALIAEGDWTTVLSDVLSQAPDEYVCFKSAVQNMLAQKFGVASPQYKKFVQSDTEAQVKRNQKVDK